MDNASKALIMAGAILIAVMLISLGVLLYNRSADIARDSIGRVSNIDAAAFNEQITQYCGYGKSAATAKTVVNLVRSTGGSEHIIFLEEGEGCITNVSQISEYNTINDVKQKVTYTILDQHYDVDGYLDKVKITVTQ